jgi:CheY-like chemotaxis protein/MinD-like ATPase involved in chromosome partitioning or flagellar assembly
MEQPAVTVLVIDPDAASRNYMAMMLQKSGYTVLLAPSGKEGLIQAWKDLPRAIIIDPHLSDIAAVALVTRLRQDRRTAKVPVVALSSRENQQEGSQLLSAGCNEYLVKSTQAMSRLIELLPQLLSNEPEVKVEKLGLLVAFLSAKGGAGTSSLCANMAMSLGSKRLETRVAVVDLVLPIGSIANIVGYTDKLNVVTATTQPPEKMRAAYFKDNLPRVSGWYLHILAGSPDPETGNLLAFDRVEKVLTAIRETYDYVFVDLGRSLSRISLPIIQRANLIALILSTDLASVALTKTVIEYLTSQGVDPERIYPILNRAVGLEGLTKAEAEQILGVHIRVTMPYMGGNFTLANNRHEPVVTKFPDDSFAITMSEATSELAEAAQKVRSR